MKTLLALGAGGVSLSYWRAFSGDDGLVRAAFGAESKATLENFTALSKILTVRDDLDAATCERMYKIFMDEPWGPDHMVRVRTKLEAALANGVDRKNRPSTKSDAWKFDEGERWFSGHVLTTWYLGIYYHNERPTQRVAYESALMFDPTRGILPVPFFDSLGFGGWADLPEGVK